MKLVVVVLGALTMLLIYGSIATVMVAVMK